VVPRGPRWTPPILLTSDFEFRFPARSGGLKPIPPRSRAKPNWKPRSRMALGRIMTSWSKPCRSMFWICDQGSMLFREDLQSSLVTPKAL